MKLENVFVQLGILDPLFESFKSLGDDTLSIVLWGVGFALVIVALVSIAYAGVKLRQKKMKESGIEILISIGLFCLCAVGVGIIFVYSNYISSDIGDKSNTDSQVQQLIK